MDMFRWIRNVWCIRWINIIQRTNHRTGTYKINKISLSWFHDKIHTLNNGYDELVHGCLC